MIIKIKWLKNNTDLGPAGLRQPAVFGIYDLDSVVENRPAYIRRISGQNMFYKEAYDKWEYDHKIERYIQRKAIFLSTLN